MTTTSSKSELTLQEQNTRRQYLPPEKFPGQYTDEELFKYFTEKLLGQNDILKTSQKDINAARKAMANVIETEIAKIVNTFAKATLSAPRKMRILFNYDSDKEKTEALIYCTEWFNK